MSDLIKGLDVSIVQNAMDFTAVKNTGIQFVILRCYVGNNGLDADYNKYVQEATDAGLYVGSYNFPFPLPGTGTRTPQWQAETHFAATKTSVVACDAEWPTSDQWAKWGCSASQINDWFLAYLERYAQLAGKNPLVYTYPNFAETVNFSPEWGNYDLWIASYQATPYIPKPWINKGWRLWQTTGGGGKLPNGAPVDTDVARDLSLWVPSLPVSTSTPAVVVAPPSPVAPPPAPVVAPSPPVPAPPVPAVNPLSNILSVFLGWFKR
jgi:lysozyme